MVNQSSTLILYLLVLIVAFVSLTVSSSVMQEKDKQQQQKAFSSLSSSSSSTKNKNEPQLLYEPNAPDYRCPEAQQSLFDKLAVDVSLSTFMSVLTQVESVLKMVNNSQVEEPFTIFAPINQAFANELTIFTHQDMEVQLEPFLKNHVVTKKLTVKQLEKTQELKTLLEDETTIQVKYHFLSQRVELNDLAEVDTDHPIIANNGIAYKINKLLRPIKKEEE
ncbi:FAS1 domain-containing protein [Circinella umbellata]|nr:FAS1 domain-containing protein [Circinella umbellata]